MIPTLTCCWVISLIPQSVKSSSSLFLHQYSRLCPGRLWFPLFLSCCISFWHPADSKMSYPTMSIGQRSYTIGRSVFFLEFSPIFWSSRRWRWCPGLPCSSHQLRQKRSQSLLSRGNRQGSPSDGTRSPSLCTDVGSQSTFTGTAGSIQTFRLDGVDNNIWLVLFPQTLRRDPFMVYRHRLLFLVQKRIRES